MFYALCSLGTDDGFEDALATVLFWGSLGRSSDVVDITFFDAECSLSLGTIFDVYMPKTCESRPFPVVPTPGMLANPLLAFSFMGTTGRFNRAIRHATTGELMSGYVLSSYAQCGRLGASACPNALLSRFHGKSISVPSPKHASERPLGVAFSKLTSVCWRRGGATAAAIMGADPYSIAAMTGHAMKNYSNFFEYLHLSNVLAYQVAMVLMGWPLQQPLRRSIASPTFANVRLAKPTSASEGTSVAPPESQPQSFIDYVYYIEEGSESPLSRSGNLRPFAESLLAAHLEHYLELEDKFSKYFRPNMRLCEGLVAVGIAPTLNLARDKCVDFGRRIAEKSAADNAPLLFHHPSPVGGEASISCNVQRVGQSLERDKTGGNVRSGQEIYCPAAGVIQDKSLIKEMVNKSTYIGSRRLLLTENRGRIISLPLEAVEERMTAAASLSSTHHVAGGCNMADSAATTPTSFESIVDPAPSTSEDSISSYSLLKEHEPPFLKHRNPWQKRQTNVYICIKPHDTVGICPHLNIPPHS